MARRSAPMNCSEADLLELQHLAEHSKNKKVAERARMMIACAQGTLIKDVASQFETRPNTVIEWKSRYTKYGIAGLASRPRGNSKDVYGDEFKERLVSTFNSPPPEGAKYWTGPLLAKQLDAPVPAVRRYLTRAGIRLNEQRLQDAQECRDNEAPAAAKVFDTKDEMLYAKNENNNSKNTDPFINEPDLLEQLIREKSNPVNDMINDDDGKERWDLGVILVARDKQGRIREAVSAFAGNSLASHDTFEVSDHEGFLDDFGLYEKGLSQAIGASINAFTRTHLDETGKKKR